MSQPRETAERDEVFRFTAKYYEDLTEARERSLEEYLELFPAFPELIRRTYAELASTDTVSVEQTHTDSPAASPAPDGDTIGPYRLIEELGRGGQAVVHLAEHLALGRKVALKVQQASGLDLGSDSDVRRFRREAEVTSRLDHSAICSVYEAGEDGGLAWIAMRYVRGETLARRIAQSRDRAEDSSVALPDDTDSDTSTGTGSGTTASGLMAAVLLIEKCARALHFAHEQGLVHRDVKPGNIMVGEDGEPVLLDFGLARDVTSHGQSMTMPGQLMGTPYYMSPEQLLVKGAPPDRRTDVYSLGVTLYECLTLRRPFDAPSREALFQQILAKEPPEPSKINPKISRDLAVVVTTALDKDRDRRYLTALDLAEDLRRVRALEPIRARPVGPVMRLWRWCRRNPVPASLTAAVAVLLVTVAVVASIGFSRESTLRQQMALELHETRVDQALEGCADGEVVRGLHELARELENPTSGNQALQHVTRANLAAWQTELHTLQRVFQHAPNGQVWAADLSPNGARVVTAGDDGMARLWDAEGAGDAPLYELPHGEPVLIARFVGEAGARIVTRGPGMVQFWNTGTGERVGVGHPQPFAVDLPFAPITVAVSGTRVATAGTDGLVWLWDASTGAQDGSPLDHGGIATGGVAFDRTGTQLLCSVFEEGSVWLWDLESRAPQKLQLQRPPRLVDWQFTAVAFSADGLRLIAGNTDDTVRQWDLATGRWLERDDVIATGSTVCDVRVGPDGSRLLTAGLDDTCRLWSAATDRAVTERLGRRGPGRDRVAGRVAFSRDGTRFLAGDSTTVWVGDANTGALIGAPVLHYDLVAVEFDSDGVGFLTAGGDTARLWKIGGRPLHELVHPQKAWSLAFSPDGSHLAAIVEQSDALLWDLDRPGEFRTLRDPAPEEFHAIVNFTADGARVVATRRGEVVNVWDPSTGERKPDERESIPFGDVVARSAPLPAGLDALDWAWTDDRRLVVTGDREGIVQAWDPVTIKRVGAQLVRDGAVKAVRLRPGSGTIAAAANRSVWLWDTPPQPLTAEPERIGRWIEVVTGTELAGDGTVVTLPAATWNQRRRRLEELGGPPQR